MVPAKNCVVLAHVYFAKPILASMKAYSSAISYHRAVRRDLPPCPDPMSVLSSSRLSSVLTARSLATYLAGSQYVTRGSLRPAVTIIGGYSPGMSWS